MTTILFPTSRSRVSAFVAQQLHGQGSTVRLGLREQVGKIPAYPGAPEVVHFDYADPGTWDAVLQDIDRIFLITPSGFPVIHEPMVAFLSRAREAGVTRVVNMAGLNIEKREWHPMHHVEQAVRSHDWEWTCLRPNWFAQNFANWFDEELEATGKLALPVADATVSVVDTRDIAAVAVECLRGDGHHQKAYDLTGPEALNHHQMVDTIAKAAGRPWTFEPIEEDEYRERLLAHGLTEEQIEGLVELFGAIRKGYAARIETSVQDILGRPPIRFDRFVSDYVAAWELQLEGEDDRMVV